MKDGTDVQPAGRRRWATPSRCGLLLLAWVSWLPAQSIPLSPSNLALCDHRNGQNDVREGFLQILAATGTTPGQSIEHAFRYVPAWNLVMEGAELLMRSPVFPPGVPPYGLMSVYSASATTGEPDMLLAGPAAYVGTDTPLPDGFAWTGGMMTAPLPLTQGTPYWIVYTAFYSAGTDFATQNQTGTDATPYRIGGPGYGGTWTPLQTGQRVKLRIRASACVGSSNVNLQSVGTSCPVGSGPTLLTSGLPLVGNTTFAFHVNGSLPNLTAALFWAPQADPVGTPVTASGCRLFLDLTGTLQLAAAGLNPHQVTQTGLSGIGNFPFPIPSSPALDGYSAAFQGLVIDANGALTLTPALLATVGI